MRITNMLSSNGNEVPNQFVIKQDNGDVAFQSYQSIIAIKRNDGTIVLDINKWDYSVTTGKYRNQFLNETKKETLNKIKNGIYKLEDLNK